MYFPWSPLLILWLFRRWTPAEAPIRRDLGDEHGCFLVCFGRERNERKTVEFLSSECLRITTIKHLQVHVIMEGGCDILEVILRGVARSRGL